MLIPTANQIQLRVPNEYVSIRFSRIRLPLKFTSRESYGAWYGDLLRTRAHAWTLELDGTVNMFVGSQTVN